MRRHLLRPGGAVLLLVAISLVSAALMGADATWIATAPISTTLPRTDNPWRMPAVLVTTEEIILVEGAPTSIHVFRLDANTSTYDLHQLIDPADIGCSGLQRYSDVDSGEGTMVLNCGNSVAVLQRDAAGNHTYDLAQTIAVADPVDVAVRGDWLAVGDTQLYGGSVRTFRRNISAPGRPFVQVQHFNEAYNDAYANFGSTVILAADQMVVGARAYGANKYGNVMGAVYLYRYSPADRIFVYEHVLAEGYAGHGSYFATDVAVDGLVMAVTASYYSGLHMFVRPNASALPESAGSFTFPSVFDAMEVVVSSDHGGATHDLYGLITATNRDNVTGAYEESTTFQVNDTTSVYALGTTRTSGEIFVASSHQGPVSGYAGAAVFRLACDAGLVGQPCDGSDADRNKEGLWSCVGGVLFCNDTTGNDYDLCDGLDNDASPMTADGSEDPMVGMACDSDDDDDLCEDDIFRCVNGSLTCVDLAPPANRVEVCNGVDDDCNPATDDGAFDPQLLVLTACDGDDSDLCEGGFFVGCDVNGTLVCNDTSTGTLELCNFGVDDDCNPATGDGWDEVWYSMPCDNPTDTDLCEDGIFKCLEGTNFSTCSDDDNSILDLCNDANDDCNGLTLDGADEPLLGSPCDGDDDDLCQEGVWECDFGMMRCTDDTNSTYDMCGGGNEDCNPATADGAGEPLFGLACDGPSDSDLCEEGTWVCLDSSMVCDDYTASTFDSCDTTGAFDGDCNPETSFSGDGDSCDSDDVDLCARGRIECVIGEGIVCVESIETPDLCDGSTMDDCNAETPDGAHDPNAFAPTWCPEDWVCNGVEFICDAGVGFGDGLTAEESGLSTAAVALVSVGGVIVCCVLGCLCLFVVMISLDRKTASRQHNNNHNAGTPMAPVSTGKGSKRTAERKMVEKAAEAASYGSSCGGSSSASSSSSSEAPPSYAQAVNVGSIAL